MDVIQLPAVPIQTALSDALGILNATKRSALVTEALEELRLVTAGAVVAGLANEVRSLSDTTRFKPLPFAPGPPTWVAIPAPRLVATRYLFTVDGSSPPEPTALGKKHQRWIGPQAVVQNLRTSLGPLIGDYALVAYGVGTAYVLTRHESLADKHGDAPKSCYCVSEWEHPLDARPPDGLCPDCAATVKCSR